MSVMRTPYSYRPDPAVPPFADDRPIIIFDGYCALCSGCGRLRAAPRSRRDDTGCSAAQSPLGQRALPALRPRSAGLRDQHPDRGRRCVVQVGRLDPDGRRARLSVAARGGLPHPAARLARPAVRDASRATGCAGSASARPAICPIRALPTGSSHERAARPDRRRLRHVRRAARQAARRRGAAHADHRGAFAAAGRGVLRGAAGEGHVDPGGVRSRRRRRRAACRACARHRGGRERAVPGLRRSLPRWCVPRSRAASAISISRTARISCRASRSSTRRRASAACSCSPARRAFRCSPPRWCAGSRRGMTRVDAVSAGIAPSPYRRASGSTSSGRSPAIAASRSNSLRDGRKAVGFGLTESRRFTIAPPGRLPLGSRRFSLVDAPDLRVLPALWPACARSGWAPGTVPEIMHRVLNLCASAVRLRLLPSLLPFARLMHWTINIGCAGASIAAGCSWRSPASANGEPSTRSWHMIAEGDDGPFIPAMACEAIIRNCLAGKPPGRRARAPRPATSSSKTTSGCSRAARSTPARARTPAGRDAALSPPARRRVRRAARAAAGDARSARSHERRGHRHGDARRGLLARLAAALVGFPRAGENVPVRVDFKLEDGRERWTRTFAGRSFHSDAGAGARPLRMAGVRALRSALRRHGAGARRRAPAADRAALERVRHTAPVMARAARRRV